MISAALSDLVIRGSLAVVLIHVLSLIPSTISKNQIFCNTSVEWIPKLWKCSHAQNTWSFHLLSPRISKEVLPLNKHTSAMTSASPGLHMTSQRLGVMPLVLF